MKRKKEILIEYVKHLGLEREDIVSKKAKNLKLCFN